MIAVYRLFLQFKINNICVLVNTENGKLLGIYTFGKLGLKYNKNKASVISFVKELFLCDIIRHLYLQNIPVFIEIKGTSNISLLFLILDMFSKLRLYIIGLCFKKSNPYNGVRLR